MSKIYETCVLGSFHDCIFGNWHFFNEGMSCADILDVGLGRQSSNKSDRLGRGECVMGTADTSVEPESLRYVEQGSLVNVAPSLSYHDAK